MTYTITSNPQFKSVEISFDGKPSEAVRTALKAMHFRWHGVKKLWYGYKGEDEVRAAIDGAITPDDVNHPAAPVTKPDVNSFGVKVGDLFTMEWGYDQTNVDFFQVVALVGESSVRVRGVQPTMVSEDAICGMSANRTYRISNELLPASYSVFVNDDEKGDIKRLKRYGNDGTPYIKMGNHYARKCEGDSIEVYESWYR